MGARARPRLLGVLDLRAVGLQEGVVVAVPAGLRFVEASVVDAVARVVFRELHRGVFSSLGVPVAVVDLHQPGCRCPCRPQGLLIPRGWMAGNSRGGEHVIMAPWQSACGESRTYKARLGREGHGIGDQWKGEWNWECFFDKIKYFGLLELERTRENRTRSSSL